MELKHYEEKLILELENVVNSIIEAVPQLPIVVGKGERVGDGISKHLEKSFVKETNGHPYFSNSEASPAGKTKNPWDAKTDYTIRGFQQEIWIDFKAVNIANQDSNPDSGTPDKIIRHILQGNFYLIFVYVYYQGTTKGLDFVKVNDKYTKAYFLKDISSTFRITPSNQMQVNYSQPSEYRTREEFLNLLLQKKIETNQRKFIKAKRELENLVKGVFKKTAKQEVRLTDLLEENKKQEKIIKKL